MDCSSWVNAHSLACEGFPCHGGGVPTGRELRGSADSFVVSKSGKDLRHNCRFDWIHVDGMGVTRALWVQNVVIWRIGPGQQLARTQLGLPSASHAISDQHALVLGDCTTNMQ